jgi:hypothetical protein
MKRDMDLIRAIALKARDTSEQFSEMEDVAPGAFFEHVRLMDEAGLIDASVLPFAEGSGAAVVLRLTWKGQDFVDTFSSATVWKAAKDKLISAGMSVPIDLLVEIGKDYLKRKFLGDVAG